MDETPQNVDLEALSRALEKLQSQDPADGMMVRHAVVEALEAMGDPAPYKHDAFVRGSRGPRTKREWGDNAHSHWVHFYRLQEGTSFPPIMVTLESSGAIDFFVGLFESEEKAMKALRRLGRYEEI